MTAAELLREGQGDFGAHQRDGVLMRPASVIKGSLDGIFKNQGCAHEFLGRARILSQPESMQHYQAVECTGRFGRSTGFHSDLQQDGTTDGSNTAALVFQMPAFSVHLGSWELMNSTRVST